MQQTWTPSLTENVHTKTPGPLPARDPPTCTGPDRSAVGMIPTHPAQTSPGSVLSLRGTVFPGSPAASITARLEDQIIGYKDLAALPADKAILDIERPDLMIYQPHYVYSPLERSMSPLPSPQSPSKESKEYLENPSPGGSSPCSTMLSSRTYSIHTPGTLTAPNVASPSSSGSKGTVQHFHRPENGSNIYRRPPIYKQDVMSPAVPQGKHIEDLIIESSKFPAAQPPDPTQPSKIETDYWPCPPSLALIEKEWKRRNQKFAEDEELDDDGWGLRVLQRQELNKIQSNLGKILLKEELDRSAAPLRRKPCSLPSSSDSQSVFFPSSSKSCLSRLQSAQFHTKTQTGPQVQSSLASLHEQPPLVWFINTTKPDSVC
uniref:Putative adherens-junction anchoring domain-containing protein n=1 Tax=Oryzias latipes TaxID=8090 RepID=A0A3P9J188_ORYLA